MAVSRVDSIRSDVSGRPRVSFNHDVHVKRIGGRGAVAGLTTDSRGRYRPVLIRREADTTVDPVSLIQAAQSADVQVTTTPPKYNSLPRKPKGPRYRPVLEVIRSETDSSAQNGDGQVTSRYNSLPRKEKGGGRTWAGDIPSAGQQQSGPPAREGPPQDMRPKEARTLGQRVRTLFRKKRTSNVGTGTDEDPVTLRYTEYRGHSLTDTDSPRSQDESKSRTLSRRGSQASKASKASWFTSIDRLRVPKHKATRRENGDVSDHPNGSSASPPRSRRYFGESDSESNNGAPRRPARANVRPPPAPVAAAAATTPAASPSPSTVYLHSAAVGDIPSTGTLHRRTLTRSLSLLGPWMTHSHPGKKSLHYSKPYLSKSRDSISRENTPVQMDSESDSKSPRKLLFTGPSFDEKYPPMHGLGRTRK